MIYSKSVRRLKRKGVAERELWPDMIYNEREWLATHMFVIDWARNALPRGIQYFWVETRWFYDAMSW